MGMGGTEASNYIRIFVFILNEKIWIPCIGHDIWPTSATNSSQWCFCMYY